MLIVIQKVTEASIRISGEIKNSIQAGLLILLGIAAEDTSDDIAWLCRKIVQLRIFNDPVGIMNLSLSDVQGELLVVSQFTLLASTKKGNRPSYIMAARPEIALPLYHGFIACLEKTAGKSVKTGEFGADMKVSLVNDGPVTIIIDSKERK
jgi:D-tyrosyl-tRNA(Tyr) deacylase